MTEHLPECLVPDFDKRLWICICNQLRACEERIKTHEGCADAEHIEGYVDGYADGLNAAREAVAVIRGKWVFGPRIYKHEALTAINALKEKS